MSRFLLLYSDAGAPAWDGDPADKTVAEHYNETTWWFEGQPDWREMSAGATQAWDSGGAALSSSTQNGLAIWEASAGSLESLSVTKPFSTWVPADDWITMYWVVRWDAGINDTAMWIEGAQANELLRMKVTTDDAFYLQLRCTNGEDLIISPGASTTSSGWHVWSFRVHNIASAGVLDFFQDQESPRNVTNASWVDMGFGDWTGTNRLWSNNTLTERWDGSIAEIILFREEHTDAEVQAINSFLATKWGF